MAVALIVELANRIAINTSKVSEYLAANGYPQPSFDVDTPASPVPRDARDIEALRQAVLRDTAELRSLLLGPRDSLFSAGSMVSGPLFSSRRMSVRPDRTRPSKTSSSPSRQSRVSAWRGTCPSARRPRSRRWHRRRAKRRATSARSFGRPSPSGYSRSLGRVSSDTALRRGCWPRTPGSTTTWKRFRTSCGRRLRRLATPGPGFRGPRSPTRR